MNPITSLIPRSVKAITVITLVVVVLFVIDQYRNKNAFGLIKPKA